MCRKRKNERFVETSVRLIEGELRCEIRMHFKLNRFDDRLSSVIFSFGAVILHVLAGNRLCAARRCFHLILHKRFPWLDWHAERHL